MMETVETTILKNLLYTDEYSRKVLPFLKKEYFEDYNEKLYLKRYQILLESIIIFLQRKL